MTRVPRAGGEFDRIARILETAGSARRAEVLLPPGDDATVVRGEPGEAIVLSTDLSVEGVHFERAWLTWEAIGYRATAAALSDLAAMAARPIGVLLSAALPPEIDLAVCEQIATGVGEALGVADAMLLGGDLTSSPAAVCLDLTAVGASAYVVGRGGANPGDELWVTGSLGGAAAAVAALNAGLEPDHAARARFERPPVRWREARWLAERNALTSAIDLSDGLAGDARHLAAAAGVRLEIEADAIPLHDALRGWDARDVARAIAVGGGEDYELLVTSPPGRMDELADEWKATFDVPITRVGTVGEPTRGGAVAWYDEAGESIDPPASHGFEHFRDS